MLKQKQYSPNFKAKMALEALKGGKTVSELASQFGVHPHNYQPMETCLLDGASGVSERGGRKVPVIDKDQIGDLHTKVEGLVVANSVLAKSETAQRSAARSPEVPLVS